MYDTVLVDSHCLGLWIFNWKLNYLVLPDLEIFYSSIDSLNPKQQLMPTTINININRLISAKIALSKSVTVTSSESQNDICLEHSALIAFSADRFTTFARCAPTESYAELNALR